MKAIGVIPARFGSTRFPGKPLALVRGKPLLQWAIEGAKASRSLNDLIVATDDERIAGLARACGVEAVLTDPALPTGTDRMRAALRSWNEKEYDVAVNIQGDEPLLEGRWLDALLAPFVGNPEIEMATLGRPLTVDALVSDQTAKIVVNARGEAIYFSRFPIPYSRIDAAGDLGLTKALKHVGLYAYQTSFLHRFCEAGPCGLEEGEGLEQLRALYLGARIKVVVIDGESWGVDTPADVLKIETIMDGRASVGEQESF